MIYMTCTHLHKTRSAEWCSADGTTDIKVFCCPDCAVWLAENIAQFTVKVGVNVSLEPNHMVQSVP